MEIRGNEMKSINFLIKPASSLCNLRCKYCFYEDEAENRNVKNMGIMQSATVENLLNKAFAEIEKDGMISFAFQGGEPTLAGLEFFKHFVSEARNKCPKSVKIYFSIQTNGTMLDEAWAKFLKKEQFLVGISIDGNAFLHNMHRVDAEGNGSYDKVMQGLNYLCQEAVDVNALCVVSKQIARKPELIYRELKSLGFAYVQFIACLDPLDQNRGSMCYSLKPEAYGKFLCGLFDAWYMDWKNGQYTSVRLFDDYIHVLLGDGASTCATCGKCGNYFVVEGDGGIYPCDFFVLDQWYMGNINRMSFDELLQSEANMRFHEFGREKPEECKKCRYDRICHGGCKNDWEKVDDSYHNYYCKAFSMLMDYAIDRFVEIADKERRFLSPI